MAATGERVSELAAVLPRGGWVQEAKASVTGNTEGQAPEAGAATKPALQLTGCLREQSDVAAFMVRLRKLYLVEDVELQESVTTAGADKAAAAAGRDAPSADPNASKPTIDNCGRLFKFDITVTFEAAAPTGKEAPRGSNAVPARLGGGS